MKVMAGIIMLVGACTRPRSDDLVAGIVGAVLWICAVFCVVMAAEK